MAVAECPGRSGSVAHAYGTAATPRGILLWDLRLVNEGDLVRVRTSVLDFHLDAEQNPQFEPNFAEEAEYSCRSWLTVNPMEAELNLKGEIPVRYTLRVPANAQPRSYNCAAGFTSLPTASEANGFGIRTAVRVVAAFYVVVGNPRRRTPERDRDGARSRIERLAGGGGAGELRQDVLSPHRNPGGRHPTGAVIESHDITPLPVLPERKQRFLFPLQKVSAGQPCTLRVRLDLGTGEIQEGTAVVQAATVP